MLVVQQMPLKKDLLDAVVAKKPVLCSSWLEVQIMKCPISSPFMVIMMLSCKVKNNIYIGK